MRTKILQAHGAAESVIDELLTYNDNVFDQNLTFDVTALPPADEPFVAAWRTYADDAEGVGVFASLQRRLPQLRFPIQQGISESPAYRAATRKGVSTEGMPGATGLVLEEPAGLQLLLHPSLAGTIPVLIPASRGDFVTLVQALTCRNEPRPIPDSMGATMVAGFNNWDRVNQLKQQWQEDHPHDRGGLGWKRHFRETVVPAKEQYQDRFIILSDGPYSGVAAAELGLANDDWRKLSLDIRLEHECTHYFTRRLLGSMRNNLLDELIADYRGITCANGRYRADWCFWFLGLESFPEYRAGGRLENYRGDPPLSPEAMQVLGSLVVAAARNLEQYDGDHADELRTPGQQARLLIALTRLTLEELAGDDLDRRIESALLPLGSD